MPQHHDGILIIDFGSQYTQLIARRVREAHVYCEIHPPSRSMQWIRAWKPRGIILSGGPNSVYDDNVGTSLAPTAGSTAAPTSGWTAADCSSGSARARRRPSG